MTIRAALVARIPRVRKTEWAASTYLRLPLLPHGVIGPWAELYDDVTQADVLHIRPGSQRIVMMGETLEDEVEPYAGPVSASEQHAENLARGYAES